MPHSRSSSPDHGDGRLTRRSLPNGWWGVLTRAALLPVLVMLPLVNLPLRADHRFNTFHFGGDLSQHPWHLVTDPIQDAPRLLTIGNFRPLGRMVERGQEWVAFELGTSLQLPVTITIRLVALLFAAVLGVVVVLLAESVASSGAVLASRPSAVAQLATLALPTMLAATDESAVVLFTSLYFASAALVLAVVLALLPRAWFVAGRGVGAVVLAVAALVGGGLAAFNEIAYLAPPLALLAVAARGLLTLGLSPAALLRTAAAKVVVALGVGFLVVFVPVRVLIARECADGGCYSASDLALSAEAVPALLHRLLSANPVAVWSAAESTRTVGDVLRDPVAWVVLATLGLVVVVTWRALVRAALPGGRGTGALAVVGAALLLLPSAMMALSSYVQDRVDRDAWSFGEGYRDTPLTAAAVALLVVAAVCGIALLLRVRRIPVLATAAVLAALCAFVTTQVNAGYAALQRPTTSGELFDRISLSMLHLEEDDEETTCALLREFAEAYPDRPDWQRRLHRATNAAALGSHGRPYCSEEPP